MASVHSSDYSKHLQHSTKKKCVDNKSVNEHSLRPNILELPEEILYFILSYLNFETVGKLRLVCQRFNKTGIYILNTEYKRLYTEVTQKYDEVMRMPRILPMNPDKQIITFLSAQLHQLQFVYKRHATKFHCRFIAGSYLDEANIVFKIAQSNLLSRPKRGSGLVNPLVTMKRVFMLHNKLLLFLNGCLGGKKDLIKRPSLKPEVIQLD